MAEIEIIKLNGNSYDIRDNTKIQKVTGATENNIALFDDKGEIKDSTYSINTTELNSTSVPIGSLVKTTIENAITESQHNYDGDGDTISAETSGNTTVFSVIEENLSIKIGQVSGLTEAINNKVDKVTGATQNNLVVFGKSGAVSDSNKSIQTGTTLTNSASTIPTSEQVYNAIDKAISGVSEDIVTYKADGTTISETGTGTDTVTFSIASSVTESIDSKIDKVKGQNGKVPTFNSTGNLDATYGTVTEITTTSDTNLATEGAIKKYVDGKLTAIYKVKGSIAFESLPLEPTVGDVYNVTNEFTGEDGKKYPAGTNVVWTEEGKWDPLGGPTTDLSNYLTKVTGHTGEIVLFQSDGTLASSGITINNAVLNDVATEVPTSNLVKQAIDTAIADSTKVYKGDGTTITSETSGNTTTFSVGNIEQEKVVGLTEDLTEIRNEIKKLTITYEAETKALAITIPTKWFAEE